MPSVYKIAFYILLSGVILYYVKIYMGGGVCTSKATLYNKVIIVTGANTGIGRETALDFARRGGKVYLACRSETRCENAVKYITQEAGVTREKVIALKLDLSSLKSVREFVKEFSKRENRLNILVNNAGVAFIQEYTTTEDGFEMTFGVNHLGHFVLTNLLMGHLVNGKPSRVVTVSSAAHFSHTLWYRGSWDMENAIVSKENYSMHFTYPQSKMANILFTRELGKRLKGSGITTYSLHPGAIITELTRNTFLQGLLDNEWTGPWVVRVSSLFLKDIVQGSQTTICCAIDETLSKETGKYYSDCAEKEPFYSSDPDGDAKKLWDLSLKLVKMKPEEIHPLWK